MANPGATHPETAETEPGPPKAKPAIVLKLLNVWQRVRTSIAGFFYSRRFRLIPTVFVMLGLAILIGLGSWQLARLHQKNVLLVQVKQDLSGPAQDLRRLPPRTGAEWEKLAYHPVTLQGTWLTMRSFKLTPRTFNEQAGYQMVVPLRLDDNQIVLVDQGFVPNGAAIMPPKENGVKVIHGVARLPEPGKPRYLPENDPGRNEWAWLDVQAMGHEVGMGPVAPVVIYEDRVTDRDSYPIGGQLPLPVHNSHKQYAVTWYCLALALMGVWMISSTAVQEPKENTSAKTEEDLSDPVARRGRYPEATD